MAIDTTTLSDLIDTIYGAGLGETSWHEVMSAVARAFGEQSGVLYEFDSRLQRSRMLGATAIDPRILAEYEQYYAGIDDWNRRGIQGPVHAVNATHDLISDAEFERTEFCADYLRQLDLFYGMGAVVRRGAGRTTMFGVQRGRRRGHYSPSDFRAIHLLVGHVDRSLAIAERIERSRTASPHTTESGIVLLNSSGCVAFATAPGLSALAAAGIKVRQSRLISEGPLAERFDALIAAIVAAGSSGRKIGLSMRLAAADGGNILLFGVGNALGVAKSDSAAIVACLTVEWQRPQSTPLALLRQHYRLTQAEAELALALAEGRGIAEIAARRGVSINTLRVQLRSIFAKTDCHRQSELVRLVLQLPQG